jgi:hypothetical protein
MNSTSNGDELEQPIYQSVPHISGRHYQPLTIRAIINHLTKQQTTEMSDNERAFLADFSGEEDQGGFIDDRFLHAAIEDGERVREEGYRLGGEHDEPGGWFGLSRFFGLYVVNWTQYGEGQENYGPFSQREEAEAVFQAAVALNTPF